MPRTASGEIQSSHILAALRAHAPGLQVGKWRAAARDAFLMASRRGGSPRGFADTIARVRMEPDAFVIDKAARSLHFFEIEVYNPMTRAKLQTYARLVTDLDSFEIEFAVYVVNKYGHINPVDLLPHYVEWLNA